MFLSSNIITENSTLAERGSLGLQTLLIGMVVVFAMLGVIFVALKIMEASFRRTAIKAKKAREAEAAEKEVPAANSVPVAETAPAAAPVSDDAAIVAAIVAAISAHTGMAPGAFRVVSFKKRK